MKEPILATIIFWLAALPALADQITLQNGDRLTGTLQTLEAGKLRLETEYAGTVTVDWSKLETLETTGTWVVEFATGRFISGRISSPESGVLQIGFEELAPVPSVVAIRKATPIEQEPGILGDWHGTADLGYTVTRGNTNIDNLAFSFKPGRRTSKDRISAQFKSLYSVQNGRLDGRTAISNMHMGELRYDRFLSPLTFVFGTGRMERDDREGLNLRASEGGGFGIRFRPNSDTDLSFFGGVTFVQENFQELERRLSAQGVAGFELQTARLRPFVLNTKTQILPTLHTGRYRVEWDANVRLPLFGGFTLGVQFFDTFDSDPPREGVLKNDLGVISTFGWSF